MSIERLSERWPQWKIEGVLGEGSFGKVYKAVREEHGLSTQCAIKVISIPQNESEIASLRSEGWSDGATVTYFRGIVDDFVQEIKVMESMKGTPNVVSVEDFLVLEKDDGVGFDIFIRMELLKSLIDHTNENKMSEADVIELGLHILGALELCAKKNIIHRDIKPENIFVSPLGYYKLGDFGIARELEKTTGSMSQKGTYNYIAPEVVNGRHYDSSVDTYSLGIVLYRLLNNNRLPFIDAAAVEVQYQDRQAALDKRLNGTPLPPPANASHAMAQAILKACAFNPKDRYHSPEDFMRVLNTVKEGRTVPDFEPTVLLVEEPSAPAPPPPPPPKPQKAAKKRKSPFKLVAMLILFAIVAGGTVAVVLSWQSITDRLFPGDPIDRITRAFENQDAFAARSVFSEHSFEINTLQLETALTQRLGDMREEFIRNSISYSSAMDEISTVRGWNLSSMETQLNEAEAFVESLHESRLAFERATSHLANQNYISAIESFNMVITEDTNYAGALEGMDRATEGYRTQMLQNASEHAEEGNYSLAIETIDEALRFAGDDAQLVSQRELFVRRDISARIQEINTLATEGNFSAAFSRLVLLESQHPDDNEVAQTLLNMERQHVLYIMDSANAFAAQNNYAAAVREIENGIRLYPDETAIRILLTDIQNDHVANIIRNAQLLASEEQFGEAVRELEGGDALYPENELLTAGLEEMSAREVTWFIAQAEELAETEVERAIELLRGSRYVENPLVFERIVAFTAQLPGTSLLSLSGRESQYAGVYRIRGGDDFIIDLLENVYTEAEFFHQRGNQSFTYPLNSQYNLFSGSIVIARDVRTGGGTRWLLQNNAPVAPQVATITIWADYGRPHQRILEEIEINYRTTQVDFSVDVTGVNQIMIRRWYPNDHPTNQRVSHIALVDMYVR